MTIETGTRVEERQGQVPLASSEHNQGRFRFDLLREDAATWARRGWITTTRGMIETPVFMPVGTQATVKTLLPDEVAATGARIILANTYHLMLRPGVELIREAGGLHRFMGWDGPILTDSGGFQVFSLAHQNKVIEEGVTFSSHIDGSRWTMTPENVVDLQLGFGSDIMMQLDHVLGLPAERAAIHDATERSSRWLERAITAVAESRSSEAASVLFGIQQGGMEADLRREHARRISSMDVAGCAVGGLSVGEPKAVMAEMLEESTPWLPRDKPRYLMGVGSPEDLWHGVARGIDMFDCVLPTRAARNGGVFTPDGRMMITASRWRHHHAPIDETCDCRACTRFTAAYIHHLFRAKEVLGLRLASEHNLRFLARIMEDIRASLEDGTFSQRAAAFIDRYQTTGQDDVAWPDRSAGVAGEGSGNG
jgi:queuine tRNA-ribosyltransferase